MSLLKYNNDLLLSPGGNYALRMPPTEWEASGSWILIGHNEVDDAAFHQWYCFYPNISYAKDLPSNWVQPRSSWYKAYTGAGSATRTAPCAFCPSAQFSGNSFYFNCNLVTKSEVRQVISAKTASFWPRLLGSATPTYTSPGTAANERYLFFSGSTYKFSNTGYSSFPVSSIGSFTSGTVNGITYFSSPTQNFYDWLALVNGSNEAYVNQWYASGKMPNGWVLGSPTISVG